MVEFSVTARSMQLAAFDLRSHILQKSVLPRA